MTHFISHQGSGYRVYRLVNGLYREYVGPFFPEPRGAMAYADHLNLRASAEESTGLGSAPRYPDGRSDSSADVRRRASGSSAARQ